MGTRDKEQTGPETKGQRDQRRRTYETETMNKGAGDKEQRDQRQNNKRNKDRKNRDQGQGSKRQKQITKRPETKNTGIRYK